MRILFILLLAAQLVEAQSAKSVLLYFQASTCDKDSDPARLRTRIVNQNYSNGILSIQIAATATCCVDFLPKAVLTNGILKLDLEETGSPCECGCCYEFYFQVKGVPSNKIQIYFRNQLIETSTEKYLTYPPKFKILNGDTVNYIDKYGLRQGVWLAPNDSLKKTIYFVYENDNPFKRVELYPDGKILSESITEKVLLKFDEKEYVLYESPNRYIEYYETEKKRKECYNGSQTQYNYFKDGSCKEWDELGKLIYEGPYRK